MVGESTAAVRKGQHDKTSVLDQYAFRAPYIETAFFAKIPDRV